MTIKEDNLRLSKENDMLREQLRSYREYDRTTGLYNKTAFCHKSAALLARNEKLSYDIVCIDIERFKLVNDLYGAEVGDQLLRYVARELKAEFSDEDNILSRIASDVYAVCLPQRPVEELERIVLTIFRNCPVEMTVTPAIGICHVFDKELSVSQMCDWAVMALDSVKHNYMKHLAVYNRDLRNILLEEQEILNNMETALKQKEFIIYLQPKCNMNSGKIVGAEALVRWRHPDKGIVSPISFIPIFERNGFIKRLDHYVWEETAAWLRRWIDAGNRPVPISINISRTDFFGMDVCGILKGILETYQLPANLLELEITESAYVNRPQEILYAIRNLMDSGFTILMDDFGSGYSSLNMLKDIDVNILKIDMGFLEQNSQKSRDILESVVHMAKWLNLPTIAEGVQNKEQVEFLLGIGCSYAQGYYYYKPMPVEEFEALIGNAEKVDFEHAGRMLPEQDRFLDFHDLFHRDMMSDRLMGNILGAIALYSFDGKDLILLRGNEEYYNMIGRMGIPNNPNHNVVASVKEEDRPGLIRALERLQEVTDESGTELSVRPVTGTKNCWVQMRLFHLAKKGERDIYYAALSDVTVQMEALEALQISEQRFMLAMEATNMAVFDLDVKTRTAVYSEYAQKTLGLEASVKNVPESFIEKGMVYEEYTDVIRETYDAIYRGEKKAFCLIRIHMKDGSSAWNRISLNAIKDKYGDTVKAIGIVELVPYEN